MAESRKNDLFARFANSLEQNKILAPGNSILLAVSGGLDSMVLLDLFSRLTIDWEIRIGVAHVNHNLRSNSRDDASFVRAFCTERDIWYRELNLNPDERDKSYNLEAWAREERYGVLQSVAKEEGFDFIATGHHLNDHAETILMHIASGCGLNGLLGIRPVLKNIIRPMLDFSKSELQAYAAQYELVWVEDQTNQDIDFTRNYIRHKIIEPWLDRDPALLNGLKTVSRHTGEYISAIDYVIEQEITSNVKKTDYGSRIIIDGAIDRLPLVIRIGLIRKCTGSENVPIRNYHFTDLGNFLESAGVGDFLELPAGWNLLCDRGNWILDKPQIITDDQCNVPIPGEIKFGTMVLKTRFRDIPKRFTRTPWTEYIDYRFLMDKRLILRTWQAGDRVKPLGMSGYKKISDLLVDMKIDRFQKQSQLVLLADDEIIWVCGRQISDVVKISTTTDEVVELSMQLIVGNND